MKPVRLFAFLSIVFLSIHPTYAQTAATTPTPAPITLYKPVSGSCIAGQPLGNIGNAGALSFGQVPPMNGNLAMKAAAAFALMEPTPHKLTNVAASALLKVSGTSPVHMVVDVNTSTVSGGGANPTAAVVTHILTQKIIIAPWSGPGYRWIKLFEKISLPKIPQGTFYFVTAYSTTDPISWQTTTSTPLTPNNSVTYNPGWDDLAAGLQSNGTGFPTSQAVTGLLNVSRPAESTYVAESHAGNFCFKLTATP
jgi:hypothetical protein